MVWDHLCRGRPKSSSQEPQGHHSSRFAAALHRDVQKIDQSMITLTVEMIDGDELEILVSTLDTAGMACAEIVKGLKPQAVKATEV